MAKCFVLGLGTFGSALAIQLHRNKHNVTIWGRSKEKVEDVNRNRDKLDFLPGITMPDGIDLTWDLSKLSDVDFIVFAVSSQATREVAEKLTAAVNKNQIIISAAKGLEETSLLRMSEVLAQVFPENTIIAFSGPGHAEEIAQSLPTTYVAAGKNSRATLAVQELFSDDTFRVYTHSDIVGVELGAAIKNVIALAAGISDGMGNGDNAKAALITRGLHEISRLGVAMGANAQTFAGLTGIGDLIVTCTSMHSRNRRCGILLGQGLNLDKALEKVHNVVEGVNTASAALKLAQKHNVSMPIVTEINKLLFENKTPAQTLLDLMGRDRINEQ